MTLSFVAIEPDGSPRRFTGMWRPPSPIVGSEYSSGYVVCSCNMILQSGTQATEHWLMGHFDRPVYEATQPDEEAVT